MPLIYILILNYNSSKDSIFLFRSLQSLINANLKVFVIDNASAETDQLHLKKYIPENNLIINKKNLGYAGGNNIGIDIALKEEADYVWILNPDIRITLEALPRLLDLAKLDPSLAAVGPRILRREDGETIFTDGEKLYFDEKCSTEHKNSWRKNSEIPSGIDYDVDYIDGSCILINCKAIKELGKLPENYFLYFEETHWCLNAKHNNWKLAVNSQAVVYNLISEKKATFHYYFMRNKIIFSKKFHPQFKSVRKYYATILIKEFINRFRGRYLRPYYKSRVKGFIAGIYKTI